MNDVAVVPFGFGLHVLEHPPVFLVHLRAIGALSVGLFTLEDDAQPELIGSPVLRKTV